MAAKNAAVPGGEKKSAVWIIVMVAILVLILFIAFAVFVIGFNAFGLRDNQMAGFLRNIPGVNRLLPQEEEEYYYNEYYNGYNGLDYEYGFDEEFFEDWTHEELIRLIQSLTGAMEILQEEAGDAEQTIEQQNVAINERDAANDVLRQRIDELEELHAEIRNREEEVDRIIAMSDPRAFQEFFETMNPYHAALLFPEAVEYNMESDRIRAYIATVNSMDESAAADMLQELMDMDINLTAFILESLGTSRRGNIISEFSSENAARIMLVMSPIIIVDLDLNIAGLG